MTFLNKEKYFWILYLKINEILLRVNNEILIFSLNSTVRLITWPHKAKLEIEILSNFHLPYSYAKSLLGLIVQTNFQKPV